MLSQLLTSFSQKVTVKAMMVITTFLLDEQAKRRIRIAAAARGITMSDLLREIVAEKLEKGEGASFFGNSPQTITNIPHRDVEKTPQDTL